MLRAIAATVYQTFCRWLVGRAFATPRRRRTASPADHTAWQPTQPQPHHAAPERERLDPALLVDTIRGSTGTTATPCNVPYLAATPTWHALPGHRLELGATGFYIQLDLAAREPLYKLYSPEGRYYGWGFDLQGLKAAAERYADERREFAPEALRHPMPWQRGPR